MKKFTLIFLLVLFNVMGLYSVEYNLLGEMYGSIT